MAIPPEDADTGPGPAERGPTRTRIQRRNERRITAAALDVFSAHGFRGTTVDAIACNAGMSKANVLYYFRTKQDIYDAVLTRTLTVWLDPLRRLDRDGEPLEEIWRYAEAKLALSYSAPQASRLFAGEMLRGAPRLTRYFSHELKDTVDEACSILQAWIDAGRLARIEPLNLVFLIWSSTQHYADFEPQVHALQPDRARVMDGARRTLRRVLLAGLAPECAPAGTSGEGRGDAPGGAR